MKIHPTGVSFHPNNARVLIRPFIPADPVKVANTIARILTLSEAACEEELGKAIADFSNRHLEVHAIWMRHYEKVAHHLGEPVSERRRLLIGAYFSGEYALESAALFNPSMVPHPDQSGTAPGEMRFIMSLRATGEGHISSIEFRTGVIHADHTVSIDEISPFVTVPELVPDQTYIKGIFIHKLAEMGLDNEFSQSVMAQLKPSFSLRELNDAIERTTCPEELEQEVLRTMDRVRWLAESNYQVHFRRALPISERIIFPVSSNESNGIEDARFVRFVHDDGEVVYYATYTAYNGHTILPQFLQTTDFQRFDVVTLNGRSVQNKGMALFPRRVNGCFAMISRQDDENIFLMFSENLHFWDEPILLQQPIEPWEFMKIGNCGSPIETEEGWLLLTHGVGPMRKYCIGAILLDLDDPSKVIGHLKEPLIAPEGNEREGYVPNVVYSCGAMVHGKRLILPYGMSDSASTIVTIDLADLLENIRKV
ncbi:MAG TPA: glycoside hydrolase family 130 protein [Chthoniobacteraceae bacterium]|nr:glycoside hydrolase family 130 protein [Chthoniobacteraceae bacterium]